MARSSSRKKNAPKKPPRRFFRWLLFWLALLCLVVGTVVCVIYGIWSSTFDMEAVKEMPQRSIVYDMDGKLYSRLQGENRIVVPLSEVSRNFLDALLVREDSRFYSHHGVDPIGVARAIVRNLTRGSAAQGASTITQQLARNSYPEERVGNRKNIHRKLLEAFIAVRIEQRFKKDEILEFYVNRIYFGAGVYGIEAASLSYFNKHASQLSIGEGATIAGIIRSPGRFSPFTNPKGAKRERDTVLDRLAKEGKISTAVAAEQKDDRLIVAKKRVLSAQENYAMDTVRRELDLLLSDAQRDDGGLKIYTTIDPTLQQAAEKSIDVQLRKVESRPGYAHPKRVNFSQQAKEDELQTPYLQGAVVVIDNKSGGIRAVVGGRDFSESKYNRATQAGRQVGSTFKPFVYAAAFARGMLPGAAISDEAIERGEITGAGNWTPGNSDGTNKGVLPAEDGLILSRNTMSVRVGERAGLEAVEKVAEDVGILGMTRQPAAFLGAFESTVSELTSAYSTFANNGIRRQSYIIERIDTSDGAIVYRAAHVSRPAIDPGVNWLVTSTLEKVFERGTAATAGALGFKKTAAGKTGTTNDFRDAWFAGYTTSLTCGVWVGLDRPQTIIPHGYGAALALPIWVDVMNAAPANRYPAADFRPPGPLQRTQVCSLSNEFATTACERAGKAYSIDLPASVIPRDPCHIHRGGALTEEEERPRKPASGGVFRSFKKFFGGD